MIDLQNILTLQLN